MKLKSQISTILALTAGMLALATTAVAAEPQASYRDANERAGAAPTAQTSISNGADAHARSQTASATPSTSGQYLDAAERAAAGATHANAGQPVGHVDVFVGSKTPVGSSSVSTRSFDWSAAAIGASSTLMLALFIGATRPGPGPGSRGCAARVGKPRIHWKNHM